MLDTHPKLVIIVVAPTLNTPGVAYVRRADSLAWVVLVTTGIA